MFNLLKPKPGDTYVFDFEAAKRRTKIIFIDDDPGALPMTVLKAEGFDATQVYKPDPGVIAQCETGVYDIIALDQAALGLIDRIRGSNPAQYLIALARQPDHPGVAPHLKKVNETLSKPVDLGKLRTTLETGVRALFDRNQVLAQLATMLVADKVPQGTVDKLVDALRKDIPSTVGAIGKMTKDAIKPVPMSGPVTCVLWQLVRTRA